MLTIVYWLIVLYFLVLTVWTLFQEKPWLLQTNSLMVLIVLLLRLMGVK